MIGKPWHVQFCFVGDVTATFAGPDTLVIAHPEMPPVIVDLNTGDCTEIPGYCDIPAFMACYF